MSQQNEIKDLLAKLNKDSVFDAECNYVDNPQYKTKRSASALVNRSSTSMFERNKPSHRSLHANRNSNVFYRSKTALMFNYSSNRRPNTSMYKSIKPSGSNLSSEDDDSVNGSCLINFK